MLAIIPFHVGRHYVGCGPPIHLNISQHHFVSFLFRGHDCGLR
jgi:hypothetical protein